MIRTVIATRYVTPLREGGSLPGLVEADDDGLYVVKFRGAGQGPRALVAEWLAGELGTGDRAAGARTSSRSSSTPASATPSPTRRSTTCVRRQRRAATSGWTSCPERLTFNPAASTAVATCIEPDAAADVVWFDALVTNPDRTAQNPNLLVWHGRPWLIDHGAALYIHHTWRDPDEHARGARSSGSATTSCCRTRARSRTPTTATPHRIDEGLLVGPGRGAAGRRGCRPTRSSAMPTAQRRAYVRYLAARLARPRRVRRGGGSCPNRRVTSSSTRSSGSCRASIAASASMSAIVLLCRPRRFLGARIALDEPRLAAFAPDLDPATVRPHLDGDRTGRRGRPGGRTRSPGSIRPSGSTGSSRRRARSSRHPTSIPGCATTRPPSWTTSSRRWSRPAAR